MDTGNHQGNFGEDYVRVLASAAGLMWAQDNADLDGVDLSLKMPGRTPVGFSPRIEVQVKTITKPSFRHGVLNYDGLDRGKYNKLAGTEFQVPRYLFVVHVPARSEGYTDLSTAGLLLRHIGYYLSLRDNAPLPPDDPRGRIRVKVPVSNVLTVASLRALVLGSPVLTGG
ncbi:DUF4365 domain-containing protein [Nocardia sp. NPDC050717]|uniref:DUF4365 domain-containing protein n=1 Tax=Nocardia sp. NPDC050717 TaxID=3157221 RepID=UPI003405BC0A